MLVRQVKGRGEQVVILRSCLVNVMLLQCAHVWCDRGRHGARNHLALLMELPFQVTLFTYIIISRASWATMSGISSTWTIGHRSGVL
jgi:hypothetical protein